MTATGVQISALWFYVHRVHLLSVLKNHRIWVILEYWQLMYRMHIEPQGRDLHTDGCHDLCADVREVARGGLADGKNPSSCLGPLH